MHFPFCWYKFSTKDKVFGDIVEYRAFDGEGTYARYIVAAREHEFIRIVQRMDSHVSLMLKKHLTYERRKASNE